MFSWHTIVSLLVNNDISLGNEHTLTKLNMHLTDVTQLRI